MTGQTKRPTTPWTRHELHGGNTQKICDADKNAIVYIEGADDPEDDRQVAAFIVKAVNSYGDLLAALKEARATVWVAAEIATEAGDERCASDRRDTLAAIDAAIAKATAS